MAVVYGAALLLMTSRGWWRQLPCYLRNDNGVGEADGGRSGPNGSRCVEQQTLVVATRLTELWRKRSVAITRALAWPAAAGALSTLVDASTYYRDGDTAATILRLFYGLLGPGVYVAIAGPWRRNMTFRSGVYVTWYRALCPVPLRGVCGIVEFSKT